MNWKRAAKVLYRELRLERARKQATQEALKMMVVELANAIQGEVEILETGWEDTN